MQPAGNPNLRLSYWVEPDGTVLKVCGPWDAWLERDGQAPEDCRAARVVGNNLFAYIDCEGVRFIYRAMHTLVMQTGRAILFPYRCDSLRFRREMQMAISREGNALRYDSSTLKETRRQIPLPEPVRDADTLIAVCSFCCAYRFPTQSLLWKDVDELFAEPDFPQVFSVTHGICEPCGSLWLRQL